MPSRWEGFSIVIIEALAAEAVFVGSNIPEIAEAVQHGHNGLLVNDYENPQAIAEMIKIACTNPGVRKKVRSNARKSVEHLEQSKVDALEVEYYKKTLAMAARGDFRMSMIDQLTAASWGKSIRDAMPVRLKKSILSFLKK
jgi:glycosyltransferase involved in cell wall biosynthesis